MSNTVLSSNEAVLDSVEFDPFADAIVEHVLPSTEAQREVWLASGLSTEASLAFNESVRLDLDGALNVESLREALDLLVARHESLRASFGPDGSELIVEAARPLDLPVIDLRSLAPAQRELRIEQAQAEAVSTAFDLSAGPLFRAALLQLGADRHRLLLTAHHAVCDGWSWGVIARELGSLYDQSARGRGSLDEAEPFGRYVKWEVEHVQGAGYAASERYWLERYAGGSLPTLDLPSDRARPAVRTFASLRLDHGLDAELVDRLRKSAGRMGVSFFGLMFGGFAALIQRLSAQSDVVVGVPAAGQSASDLHALVGHCVNLLPVRVPVDPQTSFDKFVAQAGSLLLDAFDHQTVTYGSLLKKLPVQRDPSRLPLVAVMFNVDSAVDGALPGFSGLSTRFESNPRLFENFELFVNATPAGKAYRLEIQYNTGLFDADTIARWARCYEALLRSVAADASVPLGRLNLLADEDRRALYALQPTPVPYQVDGAMHAAFVAQAARTPDRAAVQWHDQTLTYRQLDQLSNRLAHVLRARGIERGVRVGLCVERSSDMLVSLLAVLKAGAAYIPLDPSFPSARLAYYAQDAAIELLITQSTVAAAPRDWRADAAGRILELDADAAWRADAPGDATSAALPASPLDAAGEDTAYVIYTSGSTGKPKGVSVPHRAVVNFLDAMLEQPGIGADDRLAAVTTLSFDPSVLELLMPLAVGACVIVVDKDTMMDGPALGALLDQSQATTMQATPTLWRLLLDTGWHAKRPFKALIGAEPLAPTLAVELLGVVDTLWNVYGPTETTVWASTWRVERHELAARGVSIGRPIRNSTIWVVDENGQPCPIGVRGEIWIGGECVTAGYVDRPELNAERFVADPTLAQAAEAGFADLALPHDPGRPALMYRTGDLGRWNNDGRLDHLGRMDFQVKVRGYRIELGEIESACNEVAGVARSVVLAREDRPGDVRLVAYLVTRPGDVVAHDELRAHLRTKLPEYMVPAAVVVLDTLPTLPNGKIDRKALPAPEQNGRCTASERVSPRNDTERTVLAAMENVLSLPGIGITDDFFALGGHSLLAARLISAINRQFEMSLSLRVLFEAPTVERLAQHVAQAQAAGRTQRIAAIATDASRSQAPATVMQERVLFVEELLPGRSVYHEASAHRLSGRFDRSLFERALSVIIERQAAFRTSFVHDAEHGSTQRIAPAIALNLPFEDLSTIAPAERDAELRRRMQTVIESPMDLTRAPLAHLRLYKLADDEHVFLFVPHHLIWDGWSFDLFNVELATLYRDFHEGRAHTLPALEASYADYALWHQQFLQSDEYARQLAYWKRRLVDAPVPKPWPADRTQRQAIEQHGGSEWIKVDTSVLTPLRELARARGVTVNMLTLALFAALVQRLADEPSVVIGVPVRGRQVPEVERTMGFFNNLVTVQLPASPAQSIASFIGDVRSEMLEVFEHQDVPFERLVKEPELMPRMQRAGLYQVMFSYQDARERSHRWGPLRHEPILVFHQGASNDLGVWLMEGVGGLTGAVVYNKGLFEQSAALQIRDQYVALLRRLGERPDATLAELFEGIVDGAPLRTEPRASDGADAGDAADAAAARSSAGSSAGSSAAAFAASPTASTASAASVAAGSATLPGMPAETVDTTPVTATERVLLDVWQHLLGIARIERQDNFFDLGGNSLLAIQAVELIAARVGKRAKAGSFAFETLAQIAGGLDAANAAAPAAAVAAPAAPEKAAPGGLLRRFFKR